MRSNVTQRSPAVTERHTEIGEKLKINVTEANYKGISANAKIKGKTKDNGGGTTIQQEFSLLLTLDDMQVEITPAQAIVIADDLLSKVEQVYDPESSLMRSFRDRFPQEDDGTVTYRG